MMSIVKKKMLEMKEALLKDYPRSRTEGKEEERRETHYKSQPFSVDPYLIAYAIEEQKKEEQERLRTVQTKSVAY